MQKTKFKTKSPKETFLLGVFLGEEILKSSNIGGPFVIGLFGNLGSGKTVFTQGFAKGLKIKTKIKSPTFLILKKYKIKNHKKFKNFYHIDAYRIKKWEDITNSGIKYALEDKNGILIIEWTNNIKKYIPQINIEILFKHIFKNSREIILKEYANKKTTAY